MPAPPADVRISVALVRALLRQAPQYAGRSLRRSAHGWDNELWRLGEDLAVRLPRRREAAPLIRAEVRWLSRVAAPLPVAAPVPLFAGEPAAGYPYPWTVVPWLTGRAATHTPPAARDAYATELAAALRQLHAPAPADAPHNPFRGVRLADRVPHVVARLSGRGPDLALLEVVRDAVRAPQWAGPARWLHGDPHPGNVLLHDGRLSALIDFGDLCGGDPASDLGAAWLHFTPAGRTRFFAAYGADDALQRRARGWAVLLATAIRGADQDPPLRACADHALTELRAAV